MAYTLSKLVSNRLAKFLDLDVSILFALVSAKTVGTNDVVLANSKKLATFSRRPAPPEETDSTAFNELLIIVHEALVAAHHRRKALSLLYYILEVN